MAEAETISDIRSIVSEPKYNNIAIFLNDNPTMSDFDMLTVIDEVYDSVKATGGNTVPSGGS